MKISSPVRAAHRRHGLYAYDNIFLQAENGVTVTSGDLSGTTIHNASLIVGSRVSLAQKKKWDERKAQRFFALAVGWRGTNREDNQQFRQVAVNGFGKKWVEDYEKLDSADQMAIAGQMWLTEYLTMPRDPDTVSPSQNRSPAAAEKRPSLQEKQPSGMRECLRKTSPFPAPRQSLGSIFPMKIH